MRRIQHPVGKREEKDHEAHTAPRGYEGMCTMRRIQHPVGMGGVCTMRRIQHPVGMRVGQ